MAIQFRCSNCNKPVQAPETAAGKSAKCPACGQATTVPSGDPLAGLDAFLSTQQPAGVSATTKPATPRRKLPVRVLFALAALAVAAIAIGVFCSGTASTPVTTVTTLPDAFRRLELRGYSHVKDSSVLGQDFVLYKRSEPDAEYTVEISKWAGDNRIMGITFSCRTDKKGFQSEEVAIDFWDKMKHDLYTMMNCSADYHRAVADLHPVEEEVGPGRRHEGRATTADGWQILIIEDVRQNKPQYKDPEKFWARVGVVWATHLDT